MPYLEVFANQYGGRNGWNYNTQGTFYNREKKAGARGDDLFMYFMRILIGFF